jgi:hypothetical protein
MQTHADTCQALDAGKQMVVYVNPFDMCIVLQIIVYAPTSTQTDPC